MVKRTVYLDMDDTVFDTERYIRQVIKANKISYNKKETVFYMSKTDTAVGDLIQECLEDYSAIPYKENCIKYIKELQRWYTFVFWSRYTFDKEATSKKKVADKMGMDIILDNSQKGKSSLVDMTGCIAVDDKAYILNACNASLKFEMYNSYQFDMYDEREDNLILVTWGYLFSALKELANRGGEYCLEDFGREIYKRIQTSC